MKRVFILMLCAVGLLAIVAGGSVAAWEWRERQRTVLTDGQTIRTPVSDATVREVLWQPPTALPPTINTPAHEYEIKLSPDGLTLFFVRGKAGGDADIYFASRTMGDEETWSDPQPLTVINTEDDELGPELSRDGQRLYFYSDRPGGLGGFDLWVSRRCDEGWQPPENLGSDINTEFNEYGPALAPDGSALFFASNRPQTGDGPDRGGAGGWPATLRENEPRRDYDLYRAAAENGVFSHAEALSGLNTTFNEGAAAVSPAGDFLYFCSDRPGGAGGFDLYRARLTAGAPGPAANLGREVNTSDNELDPALSMGGFALHFSSDRPTLAVEPQKDSYDLYATLSREVYREIELRTPLIDWAALWSMIWPSLLWLLLALLLLLLLIPLLRGIRSRTLSLLTRCLLASLMAHLVLMILLTFWQVTNKIAEAVEQGGGTKISLGASGGDALAGQVRGNLADISLAASDASVGRAEGESALLPMESTSGPVGELEMTRLAERPTSLGAFADAMPIQASMDDSAMLMTSPDASMSPDVAIPNEAVRTTEQETANRIATAGETAKTARVSTETSAANAAVPLVRVMIAPAEGVELDRAGSVGNAGVKVDAADAIPDIQLVGDGAAMANALPALSVTDVGVPGPADERRATADESVADHAGVAARAGGAAGEAQRAEGAMASSASTPAEAGSVRLGAGGLPAEATADRASGKGGDSIDSADAPVKTGDNGAAMSQADVDAPPLVGGGGALASIQGPGEGPSGNAVATHAESQIGIGSAADLPSSTRATSEGSSTGQSTGMKAVHLNPEGAAREKTTAGGGGEELTRVADAAMPKGLGPGAATLTDTRGIPLPGAGAIDVGVPSELAPAAHEYSQRAEDTRKEVVKKMGGSDATEQAVARALQWLARHQGAEGRWAAKRFDRACNGCGDPAKFDTDIATTGLALLCFMGADHTHTKDGPYRDAVQRGLDWLRSRQREDGDLRGDETMYSHGIAAIALSEAYGMTGDPELLQPVKDAIDFIVRARNRHDGGWRYEPGQFGDTSVLGWQVMALTSAKRAGIDVPQEAFDAARQWLEVVSTAAKRGLYAYQPGYRVSASMTAEAMFTQQLLGMAREEPRMSMSAEYVLENPPRWNHEPNTYYWYYATMALFQHQGQAWPRWNTAITQELLKNQRLSGEKAGSWDPVDNWSKIGGRVYQTAICTLSLEVYYRYLPLYGGTDKTGGGGGER